MKILLLVLLSLFLCFQVNAATYFVKNGGSDGADGLSDANAWVTIAKVNGFSFSNGDIVQFKRGSTFNDATLGTPGVNDFTFQDYDSGAKPLIDGDVKRPININDNTISNLTIKNIDISGQDWQLSKDSNISIQNVAGVTIDGVIGDGHAGGNDVSQVGKVAILIDGCSGTIEVKNCTLYNWGPDDLLSGSTDLMALNFWDFTSGTATIHDNIIHDIGADGIQLFHNTVTTSIYDNVFYNFGEQAIDVKGADLATIYDNEFYCEGGFACGTGGSGAGTGMFIGFSDENPFTNDNNVIRDNNFHDSGSDYGAMLINHMVDTSVQIYNNIIEDCAGAVVIGTEVVGALVYNNLIINPITRTVSTREAGGIYENNGASGSGTKIYNNTIYSATGTCVIPINLASTNGAIVKNNIVYLNLNDATAFAFYFEGNGPVDPTVEYNLWYNDAHTNRVKWTSTVYTSQATWRSAGHTGALFSDPLFTTGGQRLKSTSPAINVGVDLSGTFTTDYISITRPQGSAWDMGAYEYVRRIMITLLAPDNR